MTKGKVRIQVDQDENDLILAMRANFFEHARHLPDNIVRQTKELNDKTIEYIMPDVMTRIKQQYGYMKDINKPLDPIARPVNVHNGKNILSSAPCFM
jgi:energy-converting hydrogenase A subunit M